VYGFMLLGASPDSSGGRRSAFGTISYRSVPRRMKAGRPALTRPAGDCRNPRPGAVMNGCLEVPVAHHLSAKKRIRQNVKRRARNMHWKSTLRTSVKGLRAALSEGDAAKAAELLPATVALINKVASKGVIHKNTASRYVSRLSRAVSQAQTS
jgi:small subunit ribosomal protein S20